MKLNGVPKAAWIPLLLGAVAIPLILLLRRPADSTGPSPAAGREEAGKGAVPRAPSPAPRPEVPGPPTQDQLLRQWQMAIRLHQAKATLDAQSVFLAREGEYREPLMKMAREDADPRIRAFSVAVLGRMKAPPPEAFFLERLGDASEHPRTSALNALEKIGTGASLPELDRRAVSDPDAGARAAAEKAAKVVRSR